MKNILLTLFLFLAISGSAQDWNILEIGQCPTTGAYDLVLADGKNDGTQRIYVTTKNGGVYEWSYQNNWSLSSTVHPGPLNNLMHIAAGDARNDGKVRIYFAEWNASARIFEATWNGSSWQADIIAIAPNTNTGVMVGDGRNDGKNRLYISGSYGLHEWEWNGTRWSNTPINKALHEVSGDIGDTRNDGVNRMVMNTNCLKEIAWNGSTFTQTDLFCPPETWTDAVQIADGRNDGIQRIYVNTTDKPGGRWEYSWTGTRWSKKIVDPVNHRGDIHMAKLKSDGNYRAYTTTSDYFNGPADDIFEYEWNGTDWVKTATVLDAISGATAMLASGNGRNDGVIRLYAPHFATGGIYEITHSSPYVTGTTPAKEIPIENMDVSVFPSPWSEGDLHIRINSKLNLDQINIELINNIGQIIYKKVTSIIPGNSEYTLDCDGCGQGLYHLKISSAAQILAAKKIIRF